jgi:multidrug efflux system membrane fusion protein
MRRKVVAAIVVIALAGVVGTSVFARYRAASAQGSDSQARTVPRPIAVVTEPAAATDFPVMRYSTGFLSSPAVVNVGSRIASQVSDVLVKDGQTVKAGDVLFRLDDRAIKAALAKDQAGLAKDQAAVASAQGDLVRARDLLAKGAGTQQAYDIQLATTRGLEAAVQADQAAIEADQVQLGYATITAPTSGRLGLINVSVGDLVGTGGGQASGGQQAATQSSGSPQPLVTITRMDPLTVTFELPQADLGLLQSAIASPGEATVSVTDRAGDVPLAQGTLDFLDSSLDTASGTIAARASIGNSDGKLWPGLFVQVAIRFGTLANAVTVPTVALQTGQQGSYVFVVGADGKASMRTVSVALSNDRQTAIASGLSAGEAVVVEGQGRLKDGSPVTEDRGAGKAQQVVSTKAEQ